MLKNLNLILGLGFFLLLVACNKDDDTNDILDVQSFTVSTLKEMSKQCDFGRGGCYELVYSIDILFADGTTATVNSNEELKEAIVTWKEANPDATERPTFAFPLEVINEDGEVITVESKEALRELSAECRNDGRGKHKNRKACFRLVFPISLDFPDGTTSSFESRQEMKTALRAWKEANPDAEERPTLSFPITVVDKDGTETIVNSQEELKAMKEACRD